MANLSDLVNPATQVVDDQKRLGNGQTWQDVTGSRSASVTYTNTTGRTISVIVSAIYDGTSGSNMTLTVGGVLISDSGIGGTWTGRKTPMVAAEIPDGTTYSVTSTQPITTWAELR